jgi:hypothetical protein
MSPKEFGKSEWVALFREAGLDEAAMQRWHAEFESRFPDTHQSFLEWLRVPGAEITRIRNASRTEWKS